jgi:hypothetical protein
MTESNGLLELRRLQPGSPGWDNLFLLFMEITKITKNMLIGVLVSIAFRRFILRDEFSVNVHFSGFGFTTPTDTLVYEVIPMSLDGNTIRDKFSRSLFTLKVERRAKIPKLVSSSIVLINKIF